MFVSDSKLTKANKAHRCTWCGQAINKGEQYARWTSVDGPGGWFLSKMHVECVGAMHDEIRDGGDREYMPFENERPEVASP